MNACSFTICIGLPSKPRHGAVARCGRPWVGDTFRPKEEKIPADDLTCALCPGNKRIKGSNPKYDGIYWFTNDLPCYSDDAPATAGSDPLYATQRALGTAEVLCYHPDHSKTFADMTEAHVAESVTIRGGTDFSHTEQLDLWGAAGHKFILGMDAHPKLVKLAEAFGAGAAVGNPRAWK